MTFQERLESDEPVEDVLHDLLADSDDAAIVSSTIGLSKQLGLTVIAEGIENRATADFLVSMGCEEGQGYVFGRPIPADAFERQFLAPVTTQEVAAMRGEVILAGAELCAGDGVPER